MIKTINIMFKPTVSLVHRFLLLRVAHHTIPSTVGISLLFIFIMQIVSGVMVGLSLTSDPLMIPISRNEEDMDDLYADDFFWVHERGVDLIFIAIYGHIIKKFFVGAFSEKQEGAWRTGIALLLLLHGVTFFGLVLCCTHLSEVTLTIAANIVHSITLKKAKLYWWLFPNQEMNIDTTLRLMYLHYVTAFLILLMSLFHSLEMHYDWKDTMFDEGQRGSLAWADDVFKHEVTGFALLLVIGGWSCSYYYNISEPASTELFMWGDVGSTSEIRFFGVTPHWYFRAYMSWLVVCPHHYLGLGGLGYFMISLYYQPLIKQLSYTTSGFIIWSKSNITSTMVLAFAMTILYGASYLAYGKFYNRLGGNPSTLASFAYILVFLTLPADYMFRRLNHTVRRYLWENSLLTRA